MPEDGKDYKVEIPQSGVNNNEIEQKNCTPKDKFVKLRRMLSTAALSTALISWMTTAKGLHHFVFDSLWQAYIISGALQGALFALSIMGIKIIFSFKNFIKRICFIVVWACLLVSSSIFSYVFISKIVYSDELFQEDVHRILATYCLVKNYELDAAVDNLLDGTENDEGIISRMNNYVTQLAVLENGIDLSEDNKDKKLENARGTILFYAYSYNNLYGKSNIRQIEGCIDTSDLVYNIDKILTGHYVNQDIIDTKLEVKRLSQAIKDKKTEIENNKANKRKTQAEIQERLKTFFSLDSLEYKNLSTQLREIMKRIEQDENLINSLNEEFNCIQKIPNDLESIENSMTSILYNKVFLIRNAMNAENIKVKEVQSISEEIYKILIENSVKINADDPRLVGYTNFKSNLNKYDATIRARISINNEIESLYNLRSIADLTKNDDCENEEEKGQSFDKDTWKQYWQEHLNSIKGNAKRLRSGGLDEAIINKLIEESENIERIYLSELNEFERAWSLLFSRNPRHPYKTLLIFSCIFAFGIDLFSVAMSCLLYLIRREKYTKEI